MQKYNRNYVINIITFFLCMITVCFTLGSLDTTYAKSKLKLSVKKMNLYEKQVYRFENKNCKWKSSNKRVVTVNSKGKVTAKKAGSAKITAISKKNNAKATCKVTVGKYAKKINLKSAASVIIKKGEKSQIKANISPSNALYKELIYTSADTKVASVDSKGVVTAINEGMTNITVKTKAVNSKKKKITRTITIIVIDNSVDDIYNTSTPIQGSDVENLEDTMGNFNDIVIGGTTVQPDVTVSPIPSEGPSDPIATNPPVSVKDYINSLTPKSDSPLVDTIVVSDSVGSERTVYILNKEYSGNMFVSIDGYSYVSDGSVTGFLTQLNQYGVSAVNSAGTVKVYRQKKKDSWTVELLQTGAKYYFNGLLDDTVYSSKFGLLIASGNTMNNIVISTK